ncbi:hypothetical protein HYDPIDRAFT_72577, partial [Hydnomerulius pinastri MD-312]
GAMFMPIISGSDKTTISVATGNNEYWPIYISTGNVHNCACCGYEQALSLLGLLAIHNIIADQEFESDAEFRTFCCHLFHSLLTAALDSMCPAMSKPDVTLYADGHYRRAIFGIGPYIADYPEQALLACIIQGWCPK